MNPIYAVCLDEYSEGSERAAFKVLKFKVQFDNGDTQEIKLQVDLDYKKTLGVMVSKKKEDGIVIENNLWKKGVIADWMEVLLATWGKNKESFNLNAAPNDSYLFSKSYFGQYSCELKKNYKLNFTPKEKGENIECSLSAIPGMIYKAAESVYSYAASFFAYEEEVELYEFKGKSNFDKTIVKKIVDMINTLEREKRGCFADKVLKADKIKGLKDLLGVSHLADTAENLITTVKLDNPNLVKGTLSHRVADLFTEIVDFEKQAKQKNTQNFSIH